MKQCTWKKVIGLVICMTLVDILLRRIIAMDISETRDQKLATINPELLDQEALGHREQRKAVYHHLNNAHL